MYHWMYFLHAIKSDCPTRLLNVLGQIAMLLGDKKNYVLSTFTGLARPETYEGRRQFYYSPAANPFAVSALYTQAYHQHTNRPEHAEYRR